MRGFAAIGLVRPKSPDNIGGVMRAAHCYRASAVVIEGQRAPVTDKWDTPKAFKHTPVFRGDDLFALVPYGAVPIGVDLVEDATPLPSFQHPLSAFYIFGPEDGTLGKKHLDRCPLKIMVPTRHCMNLAATVNVVLYDRLAKIERTRSGVSINEIARPRIVEAA